MNCQLIYAAAWSDQGMPLEERPLHDVRIADRQYVPTVASSAAVIRSVSPVTTTTGRMIAFVSLSSLHAILPLRKSVEPGNSWLGLNDVHLPFSRNFDKPRLPID